MADWNNCIRCDGMMDWRDRGLCDRCLAEDRKIRKFEERYKREQKEKQLEEEYQAWKKKRAD